MLEMKGRMVINVHSLKLQQYLEGYHLQVSFYSPGVHTLAMLESSNLEFG